jgi:hypothetical protein
MARFRDLSHVCRMHAASAGPHAPRMPAKNAPVAQLDRALDYESRGQEFESLRARHFTIFHAMAARARIAWVRPCTSYDRQCRRRCSRLSRRITTASLRKSLGVKPWSQGLYFQATPVLRRRHQRWSKFKTRPAAPSMCARSRRQASSGSGFPTASRISQCSCWD